MLYWYYIRISSIMWSLLRHPLQCYYFHITVTHVFRIQCPNQCFFLPHWRLVDSDQNLKKITHTCHCRHVVYLSSSQLIVQIIKIYTTQKIEILIQTRDIDYLHNCNLYKQQRNILFNLIFVNTLLLTVLWLLWNFQ